MTIKTKDPNYNWYVEQYGDIAVELDALHPKHLQELVRYGLGLYLDIEDMQQQQGIEGKERDRLKRFEQRVLDMAKEDGLLNERIKKLASCISNECRFSVAVQINNQCLIRNFSIYLHESDFIVKNLLKSTTL